MKTLLKRRSKAVMKKKNLLRKREWVVGKRQLKKRLNARIDFQAALKEPSIAPAVRLSGLV